VIKFLTNALRIRKGNSGSREEHSDSPSNPFVSEQKFSLAGEEKASVRKMGESRVFRIGLYFRLGGGTVGREKFGGR